MSELSPNAEAKDMKLATTSSCRTSHLEHTGNLIQLVHQGGQLLAVSDLNFQPHDSKAILAAAGIDAHNKGIGGRKRCGNIQQHIGTVLAEDLDNGGIILVGIAAPGDLQPATGLIGGAALFQRGVGTVRTMDGNAITAGNKTNDLIAGNGRAALGEFHQTVVQTLHNDTLLALDLLGGMAS